MDNIKHIGVIVHRQEDLWQATRTCLGLAVGNFFANLFIVDIRVEINEQLKENLEWLDDMECPYCSNLQSNENHQIEYLTTEKIAKKLKEMDIVIPFGNSL